MGLINKIKSALFEEVDDVVEKEVIKEPVKEEKKVFERKRNVYEESQVEKEPVISDRNIFKADKTFDFPVFDDDEFEGLKNKKPAPYFEEEPNENMSINLFDYENPKTKKEKVNKPRAEEIKGRAYDNKKVDISARKFKPSPVISPVYGVLDKNYKKEDIIVKMDDKKQIDVDDVRKKAFGTLEGDIEKTLQVRPKVQKPLHKPVSSDKSIDELLEETSVDAIELKKNEEEKRPLNFGEQLERELRDEFDTEIPMKKEAKEVLKSEVKEKKEENLENDTLESDLFELIDSMYEDKEEE